MLTEPRLAVPLRGSVPVQLPDAVQEVALVVDQVRIGAALKTMVVGGRLIVKLALATVLLSIPFLTAMALRVVVELKVIGAVYKDEEVVGVEPLVV